MKRLPTDLLGLGGNGLSFRMGATAKTLPES
jgi:hypothetical protein